VQWRFVEVVGQGIPTSRWLWNRAGRVADKRRDPGDGSVIQRITAAGGPAYRRPTATGAELGHGGEEPVLTGSTGPGSRGDFTEPAHRCPMQSGTDAAPQMPDMYECSSLCRSHDHA
jgi:hypothetical protein